MARIDLDTITKINKERNTIHTKVDATYTVFMDGNEKYIQIDTYGKSTREIKGKISQSIQIDHQTAQFLLQLFVKEYGLSVDIR